MIEINDTTLKDAEVEPHLEAIVGDDKQVQQYQQIKLQKWDNEANFSLRFGGAVTPTIDGDVVEAQHDANTTSRIYPTRAQAPVPLAAIRRVAKGDHWAGVQATAEYEMFNQIGQAGTMLLAHYVVAEPTMATFDLMPAGWHMDVDDQGYVKDFDYKDKSAYHPSDIPLPSYDRLKQVRFYTPYTPVVNPYYMDDGIHNIDIQYHGTALTGVADMLATAIEKVLNARGIQTMRHHTRAKLYYLHGKRWVKFFSAQEQEGGTYAYINIGSSYNKAYDFYRPDVDKDVRDQFAYGLQFAYPDITHDVVGEVMQRFSALLGVAITDQPYDRQETVRWQKLEQLHEEVSWRANGQRRDAGYFRRQHRNGIELEIVYKDKPASNLVPFTGNIPKNCTAALQKPVPFALMALQKIRRPLDVEGAIMFYHTDQRNNQYGTGKVGEVLRPFAVDANGLTVACSFANYGLLEEHAEYDLIDTSQLAIEVPQWFIDQAAYPITIDPTFGYTTNGGSTANITANIKGTVQTASEAGHLISLSAYFSGTTSTYSIEGLLYDTSGNLLAHMVEESGTDIGVAWRTQLLDDPTAYDLAAQDYILAFWGTSTQVYGSDAAIAYDSTGGKTSKTYSITYSADNAPTGITFSDETDRQYSIYATYAKLFSYKYPIMVGSSVNRPAADRYSALMADNTTIKSATESLLQSIAPADGSYNNFKYQLATAPGGSESQTTSLRSEERRVGKECRSRWSPYH